MSSKQKQAKNAPTYRPKKKLKEHEKIPELKKDGLSPNAITIGIMNIVIVFFWLGHSPATYWIGVMVKGYTCLSSTWKSKLRTKTDLLYLTEFCWVMCHGYIAFLGLCFLGAYIT